MSSKSTRPYDPYDEARFAYGRTLHLHPHALSDTHGRRMSTPVFVLYVAWCSIAMTLASIGLFFAH
jgi:hypothetical protein